MKTTIHPAYQSVVFRDQSADFAFLTRSTRTSSKTVTWEDGSDYPVIDVEVSSASHPFYTGKATVLDTAGRVEKFRRRYGQPAPQPAAADSTAASASAAAATATATATATAEAAGA